MRVLHGAFRTTGLTGRPYNCRHDASPGVEISHQQLRHASWTAKEELSFRAWWTINRMVALVELDATRTRGAPPWLCALIHRSGFDGDALPLGMSLLSRQRPFFLGRGNKRRFEGGPCSK